VTDRKKPHGDDADTDVDHLADEQTKEKAPSNAQKISEPHLGVPKEVQRTNASAIAMPFDAAQTTRLDKSPEPPGDRMKRPSEVPIVDPHGRKPGEQTSRAPRGKVEIKPRPKAPPSAEEANEPATMPIVMTPELPSSPHAITRDDRQPIRDEFGTKPFQLPPRDAATPRDGIPTVKPGAISTQPLDLPKRPPGESKPVTVELVEENSGVLTVADDRSGTPKARSATAEISAAVDALLEPSNRVTVELVEENTGVLSSKEPAIDDQLPDKPSRPLSAAAAKAAAASAAGKISGATPQPTVHKPRWTADKPPVRPTPQSADLSDAAKAAATKHTAHPAPADKPVEAMAVDADDIEETVTTEAGDDKSDEDLVPWVAPDDGFQLANEIGQHPQLVPNPPILPSPQEAALEAARIVSQMVDIESESGAVIAAAAAAGAAIEAAVAAQKANALDPRQSQPSMRIPSELSGGQLVGHDPVTTVRLSRDRILAALANEDIAVPGPSARDTQPRMPAAESARIRARTEPGFEDEGYEDFDPVAIAAAAIGRLRARARTDLAELRVHYHRHDVLVLLLALVIIIVAGRVHERLVTPANDHFSARGLTFDHPSSWLKPEPVVQIAPRLVRDPTGAMTKDSSLYHVELSAIGSTARLEVQIDKKPTWSNIVTGLELDRRSRWGELYTLDESSVKSIAGHDWLRTRYRYAHVIDKGDVPRVDHAVELATIDREQLYIVTIFGTDLELDQIESVVAPSLRVPSQTGLPLVPQTSRLSQRKYPTPVGRAFDSTVMVVVADLVDGRLKARGGGSGVIVGAEGSILTNYHVIHDKDGRLHDVFIIGRFSAPDRAPQLQCAGRPTRSKLQRELDLVLIKCDMDLDGRTWAPTTSGGMWATLPEAKAADVKIGQRLWVLGYPDVGGGGLTLSVADIEGWTGEDGAQGKDFIKTNGSITHGNSGGPVIDDTGKLVGIASAFRTRVTANGGVIETSQVGLVRPLQTASNLLAYAAAGWTPREGYTDVELTPTAVEASAEGIRIFTTVIDDANEQPVRDATVMVLKAGVNAATIDMNRLDDQAIAWGKTNALGEVRLKQLVPVPGTYTVMVVAPGYEPLIGENELHVDDKTPASWDPWDRIGLRSR
jgi:S1-C subfamily serine protease